MGSIFSLRVWRFRGRHDAGNDADATINVHANGSLAFADQVVAAGTAEWWRLLSLLDEDGHEQAMAAAQRSASIA